MRLTPLPTPRRWPRLLAGARAGWGLWAADSYGPVWRRLKKHRLALAGGAFFIFLVFVALTAPWLAPYGPYTPDYAHVLEAPSLAHPMGTDELGRDELSRVIYGTQLSLEVGLVSVALAVVCGVFLGAVAGYYGGRLDDVIMRLMDIILAFPGILLAIAVLAVLGQGLGKAMLAIGLVSIPSYARIARGSVLSVKESEYVEAARALGLSDRRIIWRHILPNIMAPLIVRTTLGTSEAILEAAALGFLGLGAKLPHAEWGLMLSRGRAYLYQAPHLALFPGLAITATVLALNLLGDGLRDALDPRLKT